MKSIYLYVTPFFPSGKSWKGGYFLDAAKAISRDGRYDVHVMTIGKGSDFERDGLKIHQFRRITLPLGLFPFLLDSVNAFLFRRSLRRAGISFRDVAVCHANMLSCATYAAAVKRCNPSVKAIAQFHSCYALDLRCGRFGVLSFYSGLLYLYYRSIVEKLDAIVFISAMAHMTFGKCFAGAPEHEPRDLREMLLLGRLFREVKLPRCFTVYNGIDNTLFTPGRIPHEGFVIGCVGNFQPFKGHITLLEAVAIVKDKIPNFKVRLVGSDVVSKWTGGSPDGTRLACEEFVERNGLGEIVSFESECDHSMLADFYRSIDLFVLPSRLEGFGCVFAESNACGTPFICCKRTGIAEVLPSQDMEMWSITPLDAEDLARKIMQYRNNPVRQRLAVDLNIDRLWRRFLDEI